MRFCTLALSIALCVPCLAQVLDVKLTPANQLTGAEHGQQIGEYLLIAADVDLKLRPVLLVEVNTPAANVLCDVTNESRVPVPFISVDPKTYILHEPGKQWIDLLVIDFEANIFSKRTLVVEVGLGPDPPGPEPPLPPDPPDPPDPPVPPGPFDNLAQKVAGIAKDMSDSEKQQIAVACGNAADRMQRFEFKQMDQARAFLAERWPDSEVAKKLATFLAEDSKQRILSWQQSQDYYRQIARGLE